jgi:hypothetical protein
MELLLGGEAERLTRKAIELALAGDPVALRACLDRLYPVPRDRRLPALDLPQPQAPDDLPSIIGRLLGLCTAGVLTVGEAERLAALLGSWREAVELADIERRIAALEAK